MNISLRFLFACWMFGSGLLLPASTQAGTDAPLDVVPDAVEFAALKALYNNLGGGAWTTKTNWPVAGSWPASATSAQFGTWFGVTVVNGDITRISLPGNKLTGILPAELGDLAALTDLTLMDNQLSGVIPVNLSNLASLRMLRLSTNKLTGSIPASLGELTELTTLMLGENQLEGSIPSSLCQLVKLQTLGLNTNQLTGSIPADIGNMVALRTINLAVNQLSGGIPASLGKLLYANFLQLAKNNLSGAVPPELGSMPALAELYLHNNKLTGSLPKELGNLSRLNTFTAYDNQLTGPLPDDFRKLTRMESFSVYNNRLEGTLASDLLSGWSVLKVLNLSNNQFTGDFPSLSAQIHTIMAGLTLDGNSFRTLPADVFTLPKLTSLRVQGNDLVTLPAFTGNDKATLTLAVENNRLDFTSLEILKGITFKALTYSPQRPIRDVKYVPIVLGSPLVIPMRPPGANTTTAMILWEKQLSNGKWQSVDGLNNDASRKTFLRSAAAKSDEGVYRWRMTNGLVTGLTLESEPITVKAALQSVLDNFSFQYKYDARGRVTHKKIPGADWVYMVYDRRDRLVMMQDGEQRKTNAWTFTKYDALNRPIMTGIYRHATVLDQVQMNDRISTTNFFETYTGNAGHHGYSNTVFPAASFAPDSFDVQNVLYYDKYTFKSGWASAFDYMPGRLLPQGGVGGPYPQPASEFLKVIGQVTGTKIKTNGSDPHWLYTTNYYDDQYRLIQQVSDNYKGGIDRVTTVYDFVGKVVGKKTEHTINTLTWTNMVGVRVDGDNLMRTASSNNWGYSGAASAQMIPANGDGWLETTVTNITGFRMVGVSEQDLSAHYDKIDYAFYMQGKNLLIYQKGNPQYTVPGNSARGDKLRIERKQGYLRFYRNDIQVYPENNAGIACSTALLADVSFYTGRSTINHTRMSVTLGGGHTVARRFEYYANGQPFVVWHKVDSEEEVILADHQYNELGQLINKNLHVPVGGGNAKQEIDYRYNIRGWLTRINRSDLSPEYSGQEQLDYFGMSLAYENVVPGLSNTPQFNGNISAIAWSNGTAGSIQQAYRYRYDPLNRIAGADYRQKTEDWGLPQHTDDEGNVQTSDAYSENGYEYDLGGNLQKLTRKGKDGLTMDELSYDYGSGVERSNRLLSVTDRGDKNIGFADGNVVNDDYVYNNNGSMTVDRNKNIASITYNQINLPVKVVKTTGEYVRYVYDANGGKQSQQVYDAAGVLIKRSDYCGEFFYQNDTLHFIQHDEGRVVMNGAGPEYQYNITDHLGNVRVTFTTKEDEEETAVATGEDVQAPSERQEFLRYDDVAKVNQQLFDHTHRTANVQSNTTFRAVRLVGTPNNMYGLARSFSVTPGDKITAKIHVKYIDTADPALQPWVHSLLSSLASAGTNVGSVVDGGQVAGVGGGGFPLAAYLQHDDGESEAPKAYLNYMVFDQDFNYVNGGYKRMTIAARETGALGADGISHELLSFEAGEIKITQPGFVYIYFSNENPTPVEVFFDDFEVKRVKSPIIQVDDYYPFGLTFNSYTRERSTPQMYKYNGMELQNELDLSWYDYGARMYDPAIAKWMVIDPLTEKMRRWSPYNYCFDNPMRFIDPDGMGPTDHYYAIVNNQLQYLGSDGKGDELRLVTEGKDQEADEVLSDIALKNMHGNGATTEQIDKLRDAEMSKVITFDEQTIQQELQDASDRTESRGLENTTLITLDPATATVSAEPGAEGTKKRSQNTFTTHNGSNGLWTQDGSKLVIGVAHGHPTITDAGSTNGPGYSKDDSQSAGKSSAATYAMESYRAGVGGAAAIHQAEFNRRARARTNQVGTTQATENIGKRSFLFTAGGPVKP